MDQRKARLLQRGIDHLQSGNLDAAEASFESLLASDPDNLVARHRLSMIAVRRGRFSHALAIVGPMLDDHARPEVLVHVARCQLALGRIGDATAMVDRVLATDARNPVMLASLAMACGQMGDLPRALVIFDRAIAEETREPSLYFNRALIQRELGHLEAAERDLEACLERQPGHAMAHLTLAQLHAWPPGKGHVARLQRLLERLPAGAPGEETLSLALFKELDDLGHTSQATPWLQRAISLRPRLPLPAGERRRWFQQVRGLVSAAQASPPVGAPVPIFVVGMPRAGGELLAQLLARHPAIQRAPVQCGFLHHLGRACGRESIAAADAELTERAAALEAAALTQSFRLSYPPLRDGASHVLFAQPFDYQWIGLLAGCLPEARFLHALRDPADTCLSLLAQAHGQSPPAVSQPPGYDLAELADYHREYDGLMRHWHAQFPARLLDVPYESLVEKPEMLLRVICANLGLRFDPALRAAPPLHRLRVGHWHRYLAPLGLAADWPSL